DIQHRLAEPRATLAENAFEQTKGAGRIELYAMIDQGPLAQQHQVEVEGQFLASQDVGNGTEALFGIFQAHEPREPRLAEFGPMAESDRQFLEIERLKRGLALQNSGYREG